MRATLDQMNWRRGLLRAWVVVTAVWVTYSVAYYYGNCVRMYDYAYGTFVGCYEGSAGRVDYTYQQLFEQLFEWLIGVPAAVFALGIIVVWVARGFRPPRPD